MEAAARHRRWQHPLAQVLHQDRKTQAERKVRFVEVESKERLAERLVSHQHERRLHAGDESTSKARGGEVFAARDVNVLQRDICEQRIARV